VRSRAAKRACQVLITCACLAAGAGVAAPAGAVRPVIHIEDVERFYRIYDTAAGHPDAERLQHDYLDPGSPGLHKFAQLRNISGKTIAAALAAHPETYARARRCLAVLPRVRRRLQIALAKLARLYPPAAFPPITIAVGRGRPVGVTEGTGVMIGLEALCATDWLNPDVEERFVHVIAHEYGHVEQLRAIADDEHPTVLQGSLVEGGAELVAELISGEVAYSQLASWGRGREREVETAFLADAEKSDLSDWLYNGHGTPQRPGDLGYWVGYRIVKAYYQRAGDKRRALREILEITDPKAFLARSGWYPGIALR